MKTVIALALASAFATGPALAETPLKPENFAYRGNIETGGTGPFYKLTLPLPVYQGAAGGGLADLRVFNGQGEPVPYALLLSEAQSVTSQTESAAPFFPLPASAKGAQGTGDISVSVKQTADGSLVSVHSQAAGKPEAGGGAAGVVIDASALKGRNIRSLRLVTGASAAPFNSFSVESSQDLQHWQMLKRDGQLVHLEHGGQRVDSDRAEWDWNAGRYLRLIWDDPKQAPEIKSVFLGAVESSVSQPPRVWSAEMTPTAVQPGIYEYSWTGQLPLEKLRINLAQINTLAPVSIQYFAGAERRRHGFGLHRHRDEAASWVDLAHTVVYRLQAGQGEAKSGDIGLYGADGNRLRLLTDARGSGFGNTPPSVQIGFVPHVLVFLARGNGPFTLAWGASEVEPANLPISTLVPGYDAKAPLKAGEASLPAAAIVQTKPAPLAGAGQEGQSGASKWVLWAVLLGGLLVLGGMARSLILQMRQPPEGKA
jgi:hypothetical protein